MSGPELTYLAEPLVHNGRLREDLGPVAAELAQAWVVAGVDPAILELLAEFLARTAAELGEATAAPGELVDGAAFFELPEPVTAWLTAATAGPLDADGLAALAVHAVDIAEAAGVQVFVPELPRLSAKSERTGDDARRVGTARFLRG